ncbi:hypothetical protein [Actinophytocola glycyrrhizae]|uniref:Uncharacterized protein n=1 Tax=Actinophytocola glycyrrhizae TaxID=2044873 RepID=A0ABV9S863_9PSEU
MRAEHRVGMGLWHPNVPHGGPPVLALFVPHDAPTLSVTSPGSHAHVPRAAGWALTALGREYHGGRLILISAPHESPQARLGECLVTVMAVDDAVAGGHRAAGGLGAGLVERTLRTPGELAALAATTGVDLRPSSAATRTSAASRRCRRRR